MRKFKALIALMVFFLSGCAQIQPDFNAMSGAYSRAIGEHTRNDLLLNLLRAANDLPTQFTAIPSVLGTGSVNLDSTLGAGGNNASLNALFGFLPASALTAMGATYSLNTQLAAQRQFTFTLSTLDNELFTKSFLSNITVDRIDLLASDKQASLDLLYTLVVSGIEANPTAKRGYVFHNDMADKNHYPTFKEQMEFLLDAGLAIESSTTMVPIGIPLSRSETVLLLPNVFNKDSSIQFIPSEKSKGMYQAVQPITALRHCMSLPQSAKNVAPYFSKTIRCSHNTYQENFIIPKESIVNQLKQNVGPEGLTFILNLRSGRDIFLYLGQIIQMQFINPDPASFIRVRHVSTNGKASDLPLVIVRKGDPPHGTAVLARASFLGESYYIPKEDNGLSAKVLELLNVLVTLNKVAGSIPASPGVLLR